MNPITKLRSYLQRLAQMENDYVELVATTSDLLTHMSELTARLTQQAEQMKHLSQQNEQLQVHIVNRQWEFFWRIYSEWWSWGATDTLLNEFGYIERFEVFWENELHDIWLIAVCCLLESGQEQHAIDVLRKYVNHFGTENIDRYLPVAGLYVKNIRYFHLSDLIVAANAVNTAFIERHKSRIFETYLREANSIAVVGNSNREVGRSLGKSIDAHDVVIRFNDYTGKPIVDYGERADVWVRNGSPACPDMCSKDIAFRFVVWADDYWHTFVQGNLLELMHRDINSSNYTAVMIPTDSHIHLRQAAHLLNPTSGAYMIYYLYEILGTLDTVDFYGFSFLDNTVSQLDCHAEDLMSWHEMSTEVPFLRAFCDCSKTIDQ